MCTSIQRREEKKQQPGIIAAKKMLSYFLFASSSFFCRKKKIKWSVISKGKRERKTKIFENFPNIRCVEIRISLLWQFYCYLSRLLPFGFQSIKHHHLLFNHLLNSFRTIAITFRMNEISMWCIVIVWMECCLVSWMA